jgi:hypothetical protein
LVPETLLGKRWDGMEEVERSVSGLIIAEAGISRMVSPA